MARPRVYDRPRVETMTRLPADLHKRLLAEARRRDLSANKIMELALADWLEAREGKPLV